MSDIPTNKQILAASEEELKLMAAKVMGWTGLGYYGPPTDGSDWKHDRSVRYDTPEGAANGYRAYWQAKHAQSPMGYEHPDDFETELCRWSEDGPLFVPDFPTDIAAAMRLLEKTSYAALIGYKWAEGHPRLEPHSCTIPLPSGEQITAYAAVVPLAITRAAVLAWAAQERTK
ncbi:MAG TPA: hypothetical protein VM186_05535 [Planctomycetota bacterium]|nr:hypothetical protein [Planctomycetota bacterium]